MPSRSLILRRAALPEPQDEITCEGLDLLISEGQRLLRNLQTISHDIALRKTGKRLVFALDFSELYTYLWPDKSKSDNPQVVRVLLRSPEVEFTIPPGAMAELLRHLTRQAASNKAAERRLAALERNPMVVALLRYFELTQADQPMSELPAALSQIVADLGELAHLGTASDGLSALRKVSNLRPLNQFLDSSDLPLAPDQDLIRQLEASLTLRRPLEREINNFIDAHNYALVHMLSTNHLLKKNTVYFLVTSSPVPYHVFSEAIWSRFPVALGTPALPGQSLARHPIHVLYLTHILKQGHGAPSEMRHLISGLTSLLATWARLPTYRKYLARQVPPTMVVRLPHSAGYLKTYAGFRSRYETLFSPVRAAIESDVAAEENARRVAAVSPWAVGDRAYRNGDRANQYTTVRLIFDLFDRMNRATLRAVHRSRRHLASLPPDWVAEIDTEGILGRHHLLNLHEEEAPLFGCTQVVAARKNSGGPYFHADVYDDHVSLWWTTRVPLHEFLAHLRAFLAATRSAGLSLEDVPPRKKRFQGVYLYPDPRSPAVKLPLGRCKHLALGEMLAESGMTRLYMVRIATPIGDFTYECGPYRGLPQAAGVVTHCPLADPTAWLIHNTCHRPSSPIEARRAVRRCLVLLDQRREKSRCRA